MEIFPSSMAKPKVPKIPTVFPRKISLKETPANPRRATQKVLQTFSPTKVAHKRLSRPVCTRQVDLNPTTTKRSDVHRRRESLGKIDRMSL